MLISFEQRKRFSENPDFHEVVGTERMKIKVIRPDVVGADMRDQRIRDGQSLIIELRSIYPQKKKEFNKKMSFSKDREFGLHYGIFTGLDRFGNHSWYKLNFDRDQEVLNLKDAEDLKKFPVVAMHPSVQGGPLADYEDPTFKVFDPKADSLTHLSKLDLIPKVTEFINSLKPNKLASFARYVGVPVGSDMDETMIKGRLAEFGINDPRKFIELVSSRNRMYLEIYSTMMDIGLLSDEPDKGFIYNGIYLGSSKEEVIEKMRSESNLVNGMLSSIEKYDNVMMSLVGDSKIRDDANAKSSDKKGKEKEKEKEKKKSDDITDESGEETESGPGSDFIPD